MKSFSLKIYSDIACFHNALGLWTLNIFVSHESLRKNHRADSRTQGTTYIAKPCIFSDTLLRDFFTRYLFLSFRTALKPTGTKSGSVFPTPNSQLETACPMEPSISTLNLQCSLCCSTTKKNMRTMAERLLRTADND